jgi:isopenicillin N synthase-like dioxygenase
MTTSFSTLPVVSLSALSEPQSNPKAISELSLKLNEVFSTTGFAYLVDLPLTYTHEDVFGLCDSFYSSDGLTEDEKMRLAKKTFVKSNTNTYRG